jgi:nitronate monooxygenase
MGTAFIACPESAADAAYRTALSAALSSADEGGTVITAAISGRPARCLANRFTAWAAGQTIAAPAYPTAYDAGKALNAVAKACGEHGYGAQWAGTGAARARPMPAAALVQTLAKELAMTAT